jgi:hypothetical protein
MRRIYEFLCESGVKIERLADYEQQIVCCMCGKSARRTISSPNFKLEGWSGHFPTAYHQFDRKHREKLESERKANG